MHVPKLLKEELGGGNKEFSLTEGGLARSIYILRDLETGLTIMMIICCQEQTSSTSRMRTSS